LKISPLQKYQNDLRSGELLADSAQAYAIEELQALSEQLVKIEAQQSKKISSVIEFLDAFSKLRKSKAQHTEPSIKGLYFWGGVGRGKTYLMDIFFDNLPIQRKLRLHFHRFMQRMHHELTRLQGETDPLIKIAENLSKEYRVICLDEFFVKDITDAMILSGLLDALFKRKVVLVTTSNIEPSGLYKDGLQRARFLPAIALLNKFTKVCNVDGGIDYRLRALKQAELFHSPLDEGAQESVKKSFYSLAHEQRIEKQSIEILGRKIETLMCADDVVWFDFYALCDGPRSQNDYIEVAKIYHAVLISNVPVMGEKSDDLARRFVNLIDEFYDRHVKVIISAAASIDMLYVGGLLDFEFERTKSRLLEMQSHDYLAKEHRP
jgi:cell division protein ZapE